MSVPDTDFPHLEVVFDTSTVWTKSPRELVSKGTRDLIQLNSRHEDLGLKWHLPEIVRHERQFQLLEVSLPLVSQLKNAEDLLNCKFGITQEVIESAVRDTVDNAIKEIGLEVLILDTNRVDWNSVIHRAAYREPPFDRGEKEKGFRDALIAESFLQLITKSMIDSNHHYALVTNDELLRVAVNVRIKEVMNVRVLSTLEDVKDLINILASRVEESFIERVRPHAKDYFFRKDDRQTLYYRERIKDVIREKFDSVFVELPENAISRENGTWYISAPTFVKKVGQRIVWSSRIEVKATTYRRRFALTLRDIALSGIDFSKLKISGLNLSSLNPAVAPVATPISEVNVTVPGAESTVSEASKGVDPAELEVFREGAVVFNVIWSAGLSAVDKILDPTIDSIEYVETSWN